MNRVGSGYHHNFWGKQSHLVQFSGSLWLDRGRKCLEPFVRQSLLECDFTLMLFAACRDMPKEQLTFCTQEVVHRFQDACNEADTVVMDGQMVSNPGQSLSEDGEDSGNRYWKEF